MKLKHSYRLRLPCSDKQAEQLIIDHWLHRSGGARRVDSRPARAETITLSNRLCLLSFFLQGAKTKPPSLEHGSQWTVHSTPQRDLVRVAGFLALTDFSSSFLPPTATALNQPRNLIVIRS